MVALQYAGNAHMAAGMQLAPAYVLLNMREVPDEGFAWQIRPKNYNLLTVNAFMAMTGIYQLSRKWAADHKHELPANS